MAANITTQTVYNVRASNKNPWNTEPVTIDESQVVIPGTVLGRKTVAAGTPAAGGSNTGNGALSAFALAAGGPPKIGTYVLTCVEAVTNGGVFQLTDPDGVLVEQFAIPATSNVTISKGGITFNLADGATDFAVDDTFDLPVDAGSGRGVPLDHTAVDGSQKWAGVALEEITTEAAETAEAVMAKTGDFHSQGLVFGGSTTLADVEVPAGVFIHTSYSGENIEVG